MSLNFTDDQSTLVEVMAWCRQATSHYLSQCWSSCLAPYGVSRPQWVKQYCMKYNGDRGTLTHWDWDKMVTMSQITFLSIFLNENICISIKLSLKFVPKGPVNNIVSNNGLAPTRRQTIIWTNDGLRYRRIYASLGLNEFACTPYLEK